ncbi:Probable anion transporter 6- chloroplastic [Striga hermonthica]|uniref:Probable anion transporter 6- chloroplastic n=1 Tax=Striga hermonthica TaxID=68872 RepID=A0A9N7MGX3_STRHE|nr:Probable anion transporter 6- chloroplastic [Striga hermonthica]
MARIISIPHNNFFSFSCGVNIWEPSTFRTYAEHQPSKGFQLKQNLKFGDCCSIKEAEREDGARTKEILLEPKVKCQLMENESKGEGFDFDWPPWNNFPQGYELSGRTSIVFVICNMDKVKFSISRIPMSHQSGWNASVAGLVQSNFLCGYIHSLLSGGWIVKSFGGRFSLFQFVEEDRRPFGAAYRSWDIHPLQEQRATLNTLMTMQVVGDNKGGGVLDKPIIEKTTPGRESEFDLRYGYF